MTLHLPKLLRRSTPMNIPPLYPWHACTHTYMCACVHACMRTCVHAYMHTRIHAYMPTNVYCTCLPSTVHAY